MGDTAGDIQAALETAGKLLRTKLLEVIQFNEVDRFLDSLFSFILICDVKAAEKVDVLIYRQFLEHGDFLRNDADLALQIVRLRRHLFSVDRDRTLIIFQKGKNAVDRGGFAGAVRAQKA